MKRQAISIEDYNAVDPAAHGQLIRLPKKLWILLSVLVVLLLTLNICIVAMYFQTRADYTRIEEAMIEHNIPNRLFAVVDYFTTVGQVVNVTTAATCTADLVDMIQFTANQQLLAEVLRVLQLFRLGLTAKSQ